MVGTRFRSRIGRVGIIGSGFSKQPFCSQRTIDFIGTHMIKTFAVSIICPYFSGSIKQIYCPNHIRFYKCHWIFDRTIYVRFGSQMDHSIKLMLLKQLSNKGLIGDVPFYKSVIGLFFDICNIFKIPCISKRIQIKYLVLWVFLHKTTHYMRTNKSSTTGNQYFFHFFSIFYSLFSDFR